MKNKQIKKTFFIKLLIFFNIITSFSLILSYLSGFISPNFITFLGYFGLGYIIIVTVNLLFTIIWLFIKIKYSILNLILICFGWNLFWGHFNLSINIQKQSNNSIKILSYNTHNFVLQQSDSEQKTNYLNNIIDFTKSENIDIACYQEFFTAKARDTITNDSVIKALNYKYYFFANYKKTDKYRKMDAIATFSKFPIIKNAYFYNSDNEVFGIYSDIKVNSDTIRLYNVHLCSIKLGKINDSTQEKAIYKIGKAFKFRAKEVDFLVNNFKESPYPIIVCGDFNDTPASYAYQRIINGLDDTYSASEINIGNTYFWNMPPIRIDNILINSEYKAIKYKVEKLPFSDHYPVISQIKKRNN